jgi:RNA polymerase sigma factor (sigma-70 family)
MEASLTMPGTDDRCNALQQIIQKACHQDANQRLQTALEMYQAVQPLVRPTKMTIVLDDDFAAFTPDKLEEFINAVREKGFNVRGVPKCEEGSMRITIELMPDEAERLAAAVKAGEFARFRAVTAEYTESPPSDSPVNVSFGIAKRHSKKKHTRHPGVAVHKGVPPTSVRLLERLRDSTDQEAWQRFFDLYYFLMLKWAYHTGLSWDKAEDVVADVLEKLVRGGIARISYDPARPFRVWLRTILMHAVKRELRTVSRSCGLAEAKPAGSSADSPSAEAEAEEERALLRRAVNMLPRPQREIVQGFYFEDETAHSLATKLQLSLNAVYMCRYRALRRLREELRGLVDIPEK